MSNIIDTGKGRDTSYITLIERIKDFSLGLVAVLAEMSKSAKYNRK